MIPENGQENEGGRLAGGLGPLFSGLLAATLIALTLLAAVAMGMGEQEMLAQVEPSPTATATPLRATPAPSATPTSTSASTSTYTPVPSSTFTPVASSTVSATATPAPEFTSTPWRTRTPAPTRTDCKPNPWRWDDIWSVKQGDYLLLISRATNTSVDELMIANCLASTVIMPGWKLWVRSLPTPVPTPVPAPVIKSFNLDPAAQVLAGECVQIEWVVQGIVSKITLSADGIYLVSDGPAAGSYSDCPTEGGTRRYTLTAWGPDKRTYMTKSIEVIDGSITVTPTSTSGTPTLTPTAGSPAPATETPTPIPSDTPVPPTNTPTNTPAPPTNTPTNTPVPPTSTNTPAPPTNTPTYTPEPEAASSRDMASLFDAFWYWAAVSLPQAHLPAL